MLHLYVQIVQQSWFHCCSHITLVCVDTHVLKLNISLCEFCKDDSTPGSLLAKHFCAFAKQFYLNTVWKTGNKCRKNYTRQQFSQVYL